MFVNAFALATVVALSGILGVTSDETCGADAEIGDPQVTEDWNDEDLTSNDETLQIKFKNLQITLKTPFQVVGNPISTFNMISSAGQQAVYKSVQVYTTTGVNSFNAFFCLTVQSKDDWLFLYFSGKKEASNLPGVRFSDNEAGADPTFCDVCQQESDKITVAKTAAEARLSPPENDCLVPKCCPGETDCQVDKDDKEGDAAKEICRSLVKTLDFKKEEEESRRRMTAKRRGQRSLNSKLLSLFERRMEKGIKSRHNGGGKGKEGGKSNSGSGEADEVDCDCPTQKNLKMVLGDLLEFCLNYIQQDVEP